LHFCRCDVVFYGRWIWTSQWFAPFTDHPALEEDIFAFPLASFLVYVMGARILEN